MRATADSHNTLPQFRGGSLQVSTLFSARGFRHEAYAPCPMLSIKCMFNGRALYRADRAWFAVDETGYLILNDRQPYEIHIDSPTRVESFIIFFPRGWAEDVHRCLTTPTDRLLDDERGDAGQPVHFFERFAPHDDLVSPALAALRSAHKIGRQPDLWVEQRLRELLARMFQAQKLSLRQAAALPARRLSTREELWRRLHRARDFIHARFDAPLTLSEIASVACISPFHFLRGFKAAFRVTPHEYLSRCRAEHTKFLLERTELSVTDICSAVGFESLGTFSSWFQRLTGLSPRGWRTSSRAETRTRLGHATYGLRTKEKQF